jgi:hypothetical protein
MTPQDKRKKASTKVKDAQAKSPTRALEATTMLSEVEGTTFSKLTYLPGEDSYSCCSVSLISVDDGRGGSE